MLASGVLSFLICDGRTGAGALDAARLSDGKLAEFQDLPIDVSGGGWVRFDFPRAIDVHRREVANQIIEDRPQVIGTIKSGVTAQGG